MGMAECPWCQLDKLSGKLEGSEKQQEYLFTQQQEWMNATHESQMSLLETQKELAALKLKNSPE